MSGWAVGLSVLTTRVPERLPGGEGASSALCNLSQAVYGLAHLIKTGEPPVTPYEGGKPTHEWDPKPWQTLSKREGNPT